MINIRILAGSTRLIADPAVLLSKIHAVAYWWKSIARSAFVDVLTVTIRVIFNL